MEKEKTMKELEMREALAQHRGELAARDSLVQGLRDRDHENRATIDLQRKVCDTRHDNIVRCVAPEIQAIRWK